MDLLKQKSVGVVGTPTFLHNQEIIVEPAYLTLLVQVDIAASRHLDYFFFDHEKTQTNQPISRL